MQGTVFGLSYGLSSLAMGWLIDRQNRTRLLMAGVLIWALAMAGSGLSDAFGPLVAWRMALGVITALLVPAGLSIISDLSRPSDGRWRPVCSREVRPAARRPAF